MKFDRFQVVISALILAGAMFLLLPTLHTGFLSDDFLDLDHDFTPSSFTSFDQGGFRPLIVAVSAFDGHVWGPRRPWGWHLTNIILHALCTFMLWRAARDLGLRPRAAAFSVAFFLLSFAVAPSVARVSGRTTVIAMIPFLAALSVHARRVSGRSSAGWVIGPLLFLVSLLAKETVLLCAPVFGLVSMHLIEGRGGIRLFVRDTAIFLIPTALYLAWRLYWLGPLLGYSESVRLGFFMMRNLLTLAAMPFSPWLDGLPVRMLAAASVAALLLVPSRWRTKLLVVSLIVLPLVTVANLIPRSYYSYAALPGAALLFGMAAGASRGARGTALASVILLGCLLSAHDEVSRFRQADAVTQRTLRTLDSLVSACSPGTLVFISGQEMETAGYATLWPGAYAEAMSTVGADGSRVFDHGAFWEACWPVIEAGGSPVCLFARLGEGSFRTLDLAPGERFVQTILPDTSIDVRDGRLSVGGEALLHNSCLAVGASRLLLADPFEQGEWVEILPIENRGDTALFDLESSPEWLLMGEAAFEGLVLAPGSRGEIVFSSDRLWLEPLRQRLAAKALQLASSGEADPTGR
jgi:hypothetical protein